MSFILDALTRSERERQRKAVPGLQTVHLPPAATREPRARTLRSAIGGGLVVAGAVLAWWMWSGDDPKGHVAVNQPDSGGAAPVVPPTAVDTGTGYEGSIARQSAGSSQPPSATPMGAMGSVSSGPFQAPEKPAAAANANRQDFRDTLAGLESSIVIIEAPPRSAPSGSAATPPPDAKASSLPAAAAPAVRQPQDTEGWTLITPDTIDSRNAAARVSTSAPATAGSQPVHTVHDLPDEVRAQLPDLVFSGHLYSSDPAARMIIVDSGRALSEGQRVAADLYLEEITKSGVILAFRGYRFSAGVVGNWALK